MENEHIAYPVEKTTVAKVALLVLLFSKINIVRLAKHSLVMYIYSIEYWISFINTSKIFMGLKA